MLIHRVSVCPSVRSSVRHKSYDRHRSSISNPLIFVFVVVKRRPIYLSIRWIKQHCCSRTKRSQRLSIEIPRRWPIRLHPAPDPFRVCPPVRPPRSLPVTAVHSPDDIRFTNGTGTTWHLSLIPHFHGKLDNSGLLPFQIAAIHCLHGSWPYWFNGLFLIFDIRAPECQKLIFPFPKLGTSNMVGRFIIAYVPACR